MKCLSMILVAGPQQRVRVQVGPFFPASRDIVSQEHSKGNNCTKPIKFHQKLWCLNIHLGYLVQCEPYSGKSQTVPALGLGGSVVTKLMKPLPENLSFQVTFDNLFTSLNLLQYLRSKGIGATGTLRSNRPAKCPITNQKDMAKKFRGTMDYCYDSANKIIVNDSVITLISNCQTVNPAGKAKWYSRKKSKIIEVILLATITKTWVSGLHGPKYYLIQNPGLR